MRRLQAISHSAASRRGMRSPSRLRFAAGVARAMALGFGYLTFSTTAVTSSRNSLVPLNSHTAACSRAMIS